MILDYSKFYSFLEKLNCFENKPYLAVGVSGGPDSMALAHLLNVWVKLKNGKLFALVFDHGIRSDSKEESFQVKNVLLKNLKIQTSIIKANKKKLIKKSMSNARINRFEGLINFCNKNDIPHLFLGHHFDDNLETYLIRKINGSNLEGLSSMNKVTYYKNIQILRPFIEVNKSTIINYNKKNNINYFNDPSNKDINYTRVKVRNFLENKNINKIVKKDFTNLKKKIPNYKKMIWELFLTILYEVKSDKIKISLDKIIQFDRLIIEKHVLLILKFFKKNNYTKSSKINIFINSINNSDFKIFNLSGIIIQKKSNFLIFSLN